MASGCLLLPWQAAARGMVIVSQGWESYPGSESGLGLIAVNWVRVRVRVRVRGRVRADSRGLGQECS